jgi:hypothetical protein
MLVNKTTLKFRVMILDTVTFTGRGFDKSSTTPDDVTSLWKLTSTQAGPFPYSRFALWAFVEIFRCGVYCERLTE